MKTLLALIIIAAGVAYLPSPAVAQSEGTMLMPGVYTTPEISARCQSYARRRAGSGGRSDNMRQSVFLACVQKLYGERHGSGRATTGVAR